MPAASPPAAGPAAPGVPPATLPAPGAPVPAGTTVLPAGIIRVAGGRFADNNCREFTFSGWNQCAPSDALHPFSAGGNSCHCVASQPDCATLKPHTVLSPIHTGP